MPPTNRFLASSTQSDMPRYLSRMGGGGAHPLGPRSYEHLKGL